MQMLTPRPRRTDDDEARPHLIDRQALIELIARPEPGDPQASGNPLPWIIDEFEVRS